MRLKKRKNRRNTGGRVTPKQQTKKEIKENFEKSWSLFFKQIQDKKVSRINIYQKEDFFVDNISFEANKIHVLQGDNGQGKSSLLSYKSISKDSIFSE